MVTQVYGQETYSKVIDIDVDASRNYIRDMIMMEDKIITQSIQFCSQDTSNFVCGIMSKFNLNGEINKKNYNFLTAAFYDGPNCIQYSNDRFYYSTNLLEDSYLYTTLFNYDIELEEQMNLSFMGPESKSNINNQGIRVLNDKIYIYGNVHNASGVPDSVQIIKTDLEGNEIWRKYYTYGNSGLAINNLQATPDGNLAFILQINSPNGANNGFDGYQLMKIDTAGNVIDIFAFEDSNRQPNRLLASSDGGYVFSSIHHPITGSDIFTTGYGLINKMDAGMDTLEWSLILPNDQLVDGRHYRMWDYLEAANGDIVACGMAYDNTDTELATGVPDKNSTWNGFIIRLSPDGGIKWLRLYKNNNDLLPHDEYGRFRPSRLNKIKELSDGRFIAAGDVFVKNSQLAAIDEQETEAFHLWFLMVDENGCLEGYDCEEIIRLSQHQDSVVSIENHIWIYEEVDNFFGVGPYQIGFANYKIPAFIYQDGSIEYGDTISPTFYIKNNKMYFWDHYYQEYIMYYDWQESESYEIKYYDQFMDSEEIATVIIDSITHRYFGDDSLQVQHVHILNSGTLEDYTDVVYKGIGPGYFGIRFLLGCGLCDFDPQITILRCFTNDTMTYSFVPYACDSTWLVTNTHEIDKDQILVYPNPTDDRIHIKGIESDLEYEVFTMSGHLIKKGKTKDNSILFESNGLYMVRLKVEDTWISKKVVRIE